MVDGPGAEFGGDERESAKLVRLGVVDPQHQVVFVVLGIEQRDGLALLSQQLVQLGLFLGGLDLRSRAAHGTIGGDHLLPQLA